MVDRSGHTSDRSNARFIAYGPRYKLTLIIGYRQTGTWANSEDTDEMPHKAAFHQVYTVC